MVRKAKPLTSVYLNNDTPTAGILFQTYGVDENTKWSSVSEALKQIKDKNSAVFLQVIHQFSTGLPLDLDILEMLFTHWLVASIHKNKFVHFEQVTLRVDDNHVVHHCVIRFLDLDVRVDTRKIRSLLGHVKFPEKRAIILTEPLNPPTPMCFRPRVSLSTNQLMTNLSEEMNTYFTANMTYVRFRVKRNPYRIKRDYMKNPEFSSSSSKLAKKINMGNNSVKPNSDSIYISHEPSQTILDTVNDNKSDTILKKNETDANVQHTSPDMPFMIPYAIIARTYGLPQIIHTREVASLYKAQQLLNLSLTDFETSCAIINFMASHPNDLDDLFNKISILKSLNFSSMSNQQETKHTGLFTTLISPQQQKQEPKHEPFKPAFIKTEPNGHHIHQIPNCITSENLNSRIQPILPTNPHPACVNNIGKSAFPKPKKQ